jgi:endonuclease/exonuclease/phosphatase family metal-dependent hydrolase
MLSVISYNVMFNEEYLEQRHTTLLALIRDNATDVVCLQEVLEQVVDWFIGNLADIYTPVATKLQPLGRAYGELVFIKTEIATAVSYQCLELDGKMGRALQHVEVKKDNVLYNIMTFHLESMNCSKVRREQLDKIWLYASRLPNVVCCGDTNQTAKEKVQIPINFLDAWKQTDGRIGEYTYYSGRFWDGDRKQRYDKAWYSDDLQLLGFGVLGNKPIAKNVWLSDHDGLYCLFGLKQ